MGLNYYGINTKRKYFMKEIHLCKFSAGWLPKIRIYPELQISTFDEWRNFVLSKYVEKIVDENGVEIAKEDLIKKIYERLEGKKIVKYKPSCLNYDEIYFDNLGILDSENGVELVDYEFC